MNTRERPSDSALTAAAARAAHLLVDDEPRIFSDPLAARLLGERAAELTGYHTAHGAHPVLAGARTQVTCRARYAEDVLARAASRGVTQYVILGAGLDSFAYRGGLAARLRVFEVDHPATQELKREAVRRAGLAPAGQLGYVPADLSAGSLAAGSLADRLAGAGFDRSAPAFVSWLGVTMYLTPAEVADTLRAIGRLAPGSEVVADYFLPEEARDEAGALYGQLVGSVSAERGEPWRSSFTADEITVLARRCGLGRARTVGQRDMVPPAVWRRTDALRPAVLAMLLHGVAGPG